MCLYFDLVSLFRHFEKVALEYFMSHNFCVVKTLRSFTATIVSLQLCNCISDGYLRALSFDTNGFKDIHSNFPDRLRWCYFDVKVQ